MRPRQVDPESATPNRLKWLENFIQRTLPGLIAKRVANPGLIAPTGIMSTSVRTTTVTASPVALYIDANGEFGISASTLAKKNVGANYTVDMTKFLNITLKNWTYKDTGATGMGPIADDLDAAGLKDFVIYNPKDGSIQGVKTDMLLIGLWSAYVQSRTTTLARIAKQAHQTATVASMAALSLGGTAQYSVTWPTAFADNDYLAVAAVYNTSGLPISGATAAVIQSTKTATGCTVQVNSGIALLAGQTLTVEGLHV